VVTSWDREEKKKRPGRLPLILIGAFAIACLVALLFLGDLARYQEAGMVGESQAALRDVDDYQQLDQALKQRPANRILKLVALANDEATAVDAAARKLLDDAAPATLAKPLDLTAASRSDLDALRRDLKTAAGNATTVKARTDALIRAKRDELEKSARSLGIESNTVARFMAAIDEQHVDIAALAAKAQAARSEYYGAYEKCAAVLVKEFGSYKVMSGQIIFRLQPTADSYNAASGAMAAAQKQMADLEDEKTALRQSQLNRWKKFVGG
jgi:hypothetical protein